MLEVKECVSDKVMLGLGEEFLSILELPTWVSAFVATGVVSLLPNLLLLVLPSYWFAKDARKTRSIHISNILLCFAAAALLGDVLLHLLPHLAGSHSHSHGDHDHEHHEHHGQHHDNDHHSHSDHHCHESGHGRCGVHENNLYSLLGVERSVLVQLFVIAGFLFFFLVEKLAAISLGDAHHHCHSSADSAEKKTGAAGWAQKLTPSGWLNLLADSMHNFTDGIAIGASFASGRGLAFATFLSVIAHEIPHEISDFTLLVSNGLSKSEAINAQFLTAAGAFAGTALGLMAERNPVFEDLFLALTAGGFLYIATVGTFPLLLKEKSSFVQTMLELAAFCAGIFVMCLLD